MKLVWEQPLPPARLAWVGPEDSVLVAAALAPPRPIAAVIGPAGPSGDEAHRFTFSQPSALTPWIINHNLGVYPSAVCIKSIGGVEVEASITHVSENQCVVTFAQPFAGVAVIA